MAATSFRKKDVWLPHAARVPLAVTFLMIPTGVESFARFLALHELTWATPCSPEQQQQQQPPTQSHCLDNGLLCRAPTRTTTNIHRRPSPLRRRRSLLRPGKPPERRGLGWQAGTYKENARTTKETADADSTACPITPEKWPHTATITHHKRKTRHPRQPHTTTTTITTTTTTSPHTTASINRASTSKMNARNLQQYY
jgi:hypothetical protein